MVEHTVPYQNTVVIMSFAVTVSESLHALLTGASRLAHIACSTLYFLRCFGVSLLLRHGGNVKASTSLLVGTALGMRASLFCIQEYHMVRDA